MVPPFPVKFFLILALGSRLSTVWEFLVAEMAKASVRTRERMKGSKRERVYIFMGCTHSTLISGKARSGVCN